MLCICTIQSSGFKQLKLYTIYGKLFVVLLNCECLMSNSLLAIGKGAHENFIFYSNHESFTTGMFYIYVWYIFSVPYLVTVVQIIISQIKYFSYKSDIQYIHVTFKGGGARFSSGPSSTAVESDWCLILCRLANCCGSNSILPSSLIYIMMKTIV